MSDIIERLKHCIAHSAGLVHDEKQTIIDAMRRIKELEAMDDWEAYAKKIEHDLRQRIAELEAREPLCRCADEVRCDYLKRIEELEAKLERVEGLPEKWRDISYKTTDAYTNLHGCADELQSALGDEE